MSDLAALRKRVAREMTDIQLREALADVAAKWDAMHSDPEFEGHSGSPGEWMFERMNEIETEIRRRETVEERMR